MVDLSTVIAGPGCARYLADFGADVIKVERPGDGRHHSRSMGWRDPADDVTLLWKLVGPGQAHRRARPEGRRRGRTTCAGCWPRADVLVENLRPGKLERLGFEPDELIAAQPDSW